ncbi:beta-ketoacyl synthase N-terminal-like domain-containing protein [Streptomyces sp. NPDC002586]
MNIFVTGMGLVAPAVASPADLVRPDVPDPAEADPNWFDPVPHLGRRGWKYFSPATRYLLAAAYRATGRGPGDKAPQDGAGVRSGVCVGTHHAIGAIHAAMDLTVRQEGPAGLSPAELPGFSANMPASQLAISLACQAFSVTFTNPVTGALDALGFAMSALRRGRADRVLAAATDDACPAAGTSGGAAALLLTRDADPDGAHLRDIVSGFVPPTDAGGWDPALMADAARRIIAPTAGDRTVRYAFCGPAATAPLDEAVRAAFATTGTALRAVSYTGGDGRFGTVSPLLQLTGLLGEPGPGLVIAASGDGHITALTVTGAPAWTFGNSQHP